MIKHFLFFLVFTVISPAVFSQNTSPYEVQRAKINSLLAERSTKFGQYDESLNTRTGIFGFQTKRDIKNSNEILRQIALNDNAIFRELKVLLEYKDLQMQEVKTVATTSDERIQNYRRTIKGLQDENLALTTKLEKGEKGKDLAFVLLVLFVIANGFLVYLVMKKRGVGRLA
ncbi:hypothetical protein WG904_15520 [Pedobacter sp. Du54]|uniref:hypothetical protein n=1 Tax=Pedobacter anseongensis TaxID=3133439 RepID=UPI00309B1BA5